MNASTLIDILTSGMEYSSTWAIYAERIGGEFKPESPARIGQRQFENGGLLDACEFFATNEDATDRMNRYMGDDWNDLDDSIQAQALSEAALQLIDDINAEPHDDALVARDLTNEAIEIADKWLDLDSEPDASLAEQMEALNDAANYAVKRILGVPRDDEQQDLIEAVVSALAARYSATLNDEE